MAEAPDNERFQEIIQRAASGDESAWREIVDAYGRRVYGLLRGQCGDAELAEEITQSTFCTIVTKIGDYTELGRFEPWLFRIAMNRLRDEMRRRKRQATPVASDTLTGLAGASGKGTAADARDPALGGALDVAIAQLSEADRRMIHLRHFGEMSFKQIAELLGEPLGTVLARHHRALKKLRDHLSIREEDL